MATTAAETTSATPGTPGAGTYTPPARRRRTDLTGAILLLHQKQERRWLALIKLRQAEETAAAAGVGRRESVFVRDAESTLAYATRELELASDDMQLALHEMVQSAVLTLVSGKAL